MGTALGSALGASAFLLGFWAVTAMSVTGRVGAALALALVGVFIGMLIESENSAD
jgi:hypothetical protein